MPFSCNNMELGKTTSSVCEAAPRTSLQAGCWCKACLEAELLRFVR